MGPSDASARPSRPRFGVTGGLRACPSRNPAARLRLPHHPSDETARSGPRPWTSIRKEPFPPKRLRDKRWVQSELRNPDSTEKPRLLNPLSVPLPDATESGLCDLLNPKGLGLGKSPVPSLALFLFCLALPLSVWLCFFGVCSWHAVEWSWESPAAFWRLRVRRTVLTQTGWSDAQSPTSHSQLDLVIRHYSKLWAPQIFPTKGRNQTDM